MPEDTAITDFDVILAMQQYGGSFAAALGKLFGLADEDNQARLRGAFPELWAKYRELATKAKGRRNDDSEPPQEQRDDLYLWRRREEILLRVLRLYAQCRHGCVDCFCTKEAQDTLTLMERL